MSRERELREESFDPPLSSSVPKLKSNASSSSSLSESTTTTTSKWSSFSLFGKAHSPSPRGEGSPSSQQGQSSKGHAEEEGFSPDDCEVFFGRFWAEVAIFSFDKGKEIAEKEKERALKHVAVAGSSASSSSSASGFTWVIITTALSQLSQAERAYVNLTFLAPKGFLRKDSNLRSTYDNIKLDLKKVAESSIMPFPSKHSHPEIANAVLAVVNFRLEMIEFYEKLALYGSAKNVEIADLIAEVDSIVGKFADEQKRIGDSIAVLHGMINSLNWECQIVCNLLKLIHALQTWTYLDATIALQLTHSGFQEWSELVQLHSTTLKKSTFYSSAPTLPTLFLWVKRLKGLLVSKYTLYFYELLAQHSNPTYDIRNYSAKLPVDFYSRLSMFQKKGDALCICIVFDARGTLFYRNGYRFPTRKPDHLEGLDSFPSIVSIPAKPLQYWPSVIMILGDKTNELNADRTVAIFDTSAHMTYYMQKIDVRMYLLVMYESKKSEKDLYTQKFMSDLAFELKGSKIFSSLKSFKQ